MPRAKSTGRKLEGRKRKRKEEREDLKFCYINLQKIVNKRYSSKSNAVDIFILCLFIISFGLIIGGGIFGNLYFIGSGTILLIFLWYLLK